MTSNNALLKHSAGRCVKKLPSPLHLPYVYEDRSYTYFILAWDLTRQCQTKLTKFVTQAIIFSSYLYLTTPANAISLTNYLLLLYARCFYCNYPKIDSQRLHKTMNSCFSLDTRGIDISSVQISLAKIDGLRSPVPCTSRVYLHLYECPF